MSTAADQIPIAPGYQVSDVTAPAAAPRASSPDAPILNFFSVQSARYEVTTRIHNGRRSWRSITIRSTPGTSPGCSTRWASRSTTTSAISAPTSSTSPDPRIPRLRELRPGVRRHLALVGGPGVHRRYRRSHPHRPGQLRRGHELAHQWWAHQVVGARQQGDTMLDETLAQYSALMVMKHMYGPDLIRKFLKFELDSLPAGPRPARRSRSCRSSASSTSRYIHYRKGSLVMYRLQHDRRGRGQSRPLALPCRIRASRARLSRARSTWWPTCAPRRRLRQSSSRSPTSSRRSRSTTSRRRRR